MVYAGLMVAATGVSIASGVTAPIAFVTGGGAFVVKKTIEVAEVIENMTGKFYVGLVGLNKRLQI